MYTIDGRGQPSRLLFLMHGYSANEYHLAAFGPLIDPDANYLVAAPRAPLHIPPVGAAWWDFFASDPLVALANQREAVELADATLDRVCAERGFDRATAVIGGFSQGALVALAMAYRRSDKPRPAGVIALSGFWPEEGVDWDFRTSKTVPAFVARGTADPFIDADAGQRVVDQLGGNDVDVTAKVYEGMGHDICIEELADLRAWLAAR